MTPYAGIDLHSNNNVVVVQDEEDTFSFGAGGPRIAIRGLCGAFH